MLVRFETEMVTLDVGVATMSMLLVMVMIIMMVIMEMIPMVVMRW